MRKTQMWFLSGATALALAFAAASTEGGAVAISSSDARTSETQVGKGLPPSPQLRSQPQDAVAAADVARGWLTYSTASRRSAWTPSGPRCVELLFGLAVLLLLLAFPAGAKQSAKFVAFVSRGCARGAKRAQSQPGGTRGLGASGCASSFAEDCGKG